MTYYDPDPKILNFVYKSAERALYQKCQVKALLPPKDDLKVVSLVFNALITRADKTYDHQADPARLTDKSYMDEFLVKILENVNIPYDPRNPEAFKTSLRQIMSPSYTLRAIINPIPGVPNTDGAKDNTIGKNEDIIIE